MNNLRSELMVGSFALVVLTLLSLMTFRVGDYTVGKKDGYLVYARFNNTAGLSEKTKVKVAGVGAGTVERITLKDGRAIVRLRMKKRVRLYSDAKAFIRASGLLGDKYVEVSTGSEGPLITDGGEIKSTGDVADIDSLIKNLTVVSENLAIMSGQLVERGAHDTIADILDNIEDLTSELSSAIAGEKKNLSTILDRLESMITTLDKTVQENAGSISKTVSNIEGFSSTLKNETPDIMDDLHSAIARLDRLLEQTSPHIVSMTNSADATMGQFHEIATKVNKGEGTMGKLVNDDSLYNNVARAAGGVSNTLGKVNRLRVFVTFRGDYLTKAEEGRGEFNVELSPRKNKAYILGIVTDPVGNVSVSEKIVNGVTTRTEEVTQQIEFNAQIANRFKDTRLRIGLFESTFGLGADHYLYKDRVKLTFDAWDFANNEYLSSEPHLRLGVNVFATRNIFISGGIDNPLNEYHRGYFLGGGVRFEDDDLKYIMGSIPGLPGN